MAGTSKEKSKLGGRGERRERRKRRKEEEMEAGERGEGQSTNPSSANPHRGGGGGGRRTTTSRVDWGSWSSKDTSVWVEG